MSNMNAQSAQPQPPREVAFSLPSGAYATVVLREITKSEEVERDEEEESEDR